MYCSVVDGSFSLSLSLFFVYSSMTGMIEELDHHIIDGMVAPKKDIMSHWVQFLVRKGLWRSGILQQGTK